MKRPYITLKFAQTLDGRIAARDGSSKWISGPGSLKLTHKLRARNDAILIGVGTVLQDNPSLTVRLAKGKNPTRIIIDPKLRTPYTSRVIKNTKIAKTIIVTARKAPKVKVAQFRQKGVEFVFLPLSKRGYIDLEKIISILYKKGIKSMLVEGGGRIITSFMKKGLVDKLIAIISPKILGKGKDAVGDLGIGNIKWALKLRIKSAKHLGKDIVYTAFLDK
ncbi:MAG: bifunctional diaminohydroxyphosphoribosylaminopyrimidine deaminase/5-amino-6-(5-phosphoribosylamino)uracil reductase RibD [Candidatus Omnitrophica bacterium]|nr:bifunctional diaminohydroxyphosphoribosylaminopyrimidine deaminase/5-amino-6-(5-phosphoribosylamino)uracil reductase RibD [Candidatus Omnitrophota bacterium]